MVASNAALAQSKRPSKVSVAHKSIKLREQRPEQAKEIARKFNLSPVAARILAARGHGANETLQHYLNPTLKEGLPDPKFLKNLDAAACVIGEVVRAKKSIAICCDFDVDGLSGGSQVAHFFKTLGISVKVFVPDRFVDGYGLNANMIDAIVSGGFALLIAIDFGTTNIHELELARRKGLRTIVIDHHHVGNHQSPADVFINPQQEGCGFADKILCAAGLAWYLLVGLKQNLPEAKAVEIRSYLDLACLGTICDMVPLIGANRVIAKRGLELLTQTKRPGLVALKNVIGIRGDVGCSDISFGIGPRLNAAGRMVHGEMVVELLTTDNSDTAKKIAQKLHQLNLERQEIESSVKNAAIKQVHQSGQLPHGIVVWDESFHTGVIGIVAQRLVETFYRPSAVMGVDSPGIFKGSVRGIKGLSVVETLGAVSTHLLKFGGHEGAGGFSVEAAKLNDFAAAFCEECERRLSALETSPCAEADTEVTLPEISVSLVEELKKFSPFGMGNPNPLVLIRSLKVHEVKVIKGAHLKTLLTDGRNYITGLMWRQNEHPALAVGNRVDIICRPEFSTYGGQTEMQATLQAIELA